MANLMNRIAKDGSEYKSNLGNLSQIKYLFSEQASPIWSQSIRSFYAGLNDTMAAMVATPTLISNVLNRATNSQIMREEPGFNRRNEKNIMAGDLMGVIVDAAVYASIMGGNNYALAALIT